MEETQETVEALATAADLVKQEGISPNSGKVFGIELHAGVNFGGFVGGTVNVKNNHQLTLAEETNGIRVRGPKCHKLIPWAALKGVDYFNEDGSEPVSGKSRV